MMRRLFALPLIAACFAAPALAEPPMPESCKPRVAGVALAVADDAGKAQLACDVDRAAIYESRADAIFGPVTDPLVRAKLLPKSPIVMGWERYNCSTARISVTPKSRCRAVSAALSSRCDARARVSRAT